MRKSEGINEPGLKHYTLIPIRILNKAREFYLKGMEDCVGKIRCDQVIVACQYYTVPLSNLPRNAAGVKSSDDDHLKRLLRTMPKKKADMGCGGIMMGRNYSVRLGKIGTIDEDRPCTFEEDEILDVCRGRRSSYALQ